jgi:hypothetical protein
MGLVVVFILKDVPFFIHHLLVCAELIFMFHEVDDRSLGLKVSSVVFLCCIQGILVCLFVPEPSSDRANVPARHFNRKVDGRKLLSSLGLDGGDFFGGGYAMCSAIEHIYVDIGGARRCPILASLVSSQLRLVRCYSSRAPRTLGKLCRVQLVQADMRDVTGSLSTCRHCCICTMLCRNHSHL